MVLPLFFITFQAIQKIKGEIPIPPFTNQNYNLSIYNRLLLNILYVINQKYGLNL